MGLFDYISSWFRANKHTLSPDQQREVIRLLDKMRTEMQDNINSANSNTSRRLEDIINSHSRKLSQNINDSKEYCMNEMTRLSDELEKLKKQLDAAEGKKKKKEKEKEDENNDTANRHEAEYKIFLDQQKLILEQMKIFAEVQKSAYQHAGPPGGFPPNSSSNQWQQPPASAPGYQNSPYQPNCYNPNLANQQGYQAPGWNEAPSHVSASSAPPPSSAPPSSRAPSTSSGIYPDLPSTFSANATSIKTSKPSAPLDSLPGCGLILPDTRDYNKVITASLRKPLEDVEFEIMIENFAQELRPGSRPGSKSNLSRNEDNEKKFADTVKNFFLKDRNELNIPNRRRVSRTSAASSSNASVKEWLKKNQSFASDDDSDESDTSEVSVRTDASKFSSVSATSGKRVFWNKPGNYGKPAPASNSSSQSANKRKPVEHRPNKDYGKPASVTSSSSQPANSDKSSELRTNKGNTRNQNYKYTSTNQRRYNKAQRELNDLNADQKDKDSNLIPKKQHSNYAQKNKRSNRTQNDSASVTSAAGSSRLSEIHYPSREEAARKEVDLFKPLARELLFLGKNENDEWTTHNPKCLNDIYDLEKLYKVFRTIEIA